MNEENPTQLAKQFRTVAKDFSKYWAAYEGWRSLLTSPYFIVSWILTIVLAPMWLKPEWWSDVISAAPSLLGFSLGGMALLLAFGDDRFKSLLARAGGESPRLVRTSAAFVHFIFIQCVAWIAALICKAWYFPAPRAVVDTFVATGISEDAFILLTRLAWGPAFFLFVYSILCALAATFRIFNTTTTFVTVIRADAAKAEVARVAAEQRTIEESRQGRRLGPVESHSESAPPAPPVAE